eukprot:TRINITY_DN5505_c0_g1_i1.p1 TRINITY_DN5505_c0_g1~~TRINITY_DN5505_c0_g1_i1.p1  ORF type:complete len:100 (+),score=17.91 TRINITY_DN5505_c0_g1_i1:194-493(+)
MVCEDCEKKREAVACPDPWKDGARTVDRKAASGNKLLQNRRKMTPYGNKPGALSTKCTDCKQSLPNPGKYCSGCAYKKGLCSDCGKQIMDVRAYKQSSK